jgi:cytochrome c biogenesis protein CcmG/thiol:disulfide interchange protein DsbE
MEQQKTPRNQSLILVIIGLGLVLVALVGYLLISKAQAAVQSQDLAAQPVQDVFPALDVKLADLRGHPAALSDYTGQVIIYNAWATWCPPCNDEMPELEMYYRAHQRDGLVVIAIEDGQPAPEVAQYVRTHGLTFPVWPDTAWVATNTYGITNLPTSFVIDRTFNVRLTWVGPITLEKLEQYVTPLLKEGQD